MKPKIVFTLALGTLLSFGSCNDYLDMSPTDKTTDKVTWANTKNAELAVNYFYHITGYLGQYDEGQSLAGMTEGFTDMLKYGSMNYNAHMYIPNEIAYGGNVLSASYVNIYMGNWVTMYENVRRINEGIFNLHKHGTMSAEDSKRLEAEMRFFRGMVYYDLVKRYKKVIIYNEDLGQIQRDKALSPEADGWNFVEEDLTFAAKNLPKSTTANGRVTKGAAFALLSRAMLYAEKWKVAKDAADSVMIEGYKLTNDYTDAFQNNSTEAIWQYSYDKAGVTHGFDNYFAPGGDEGNSMRGGYGTPTQEMVESFELAVGGFPDWSPWHTTTGTDAEPPYANLEPRFKASVLYNGATWKGRAVEPFIGGVDGWASWKDDPVPDGRTTTGYYLKKLVDESHDFKTLTTSTQPWVAIRYAEVILNRAEACFRLGEAAEANNNVRSIRTRVDLPYTNKSGDALMAAIRQERKVELAYEGQYYWDMKRWKLAHTAFTGLRVHGLKVEKNANGTFKYTYVDCDKQDRNFPAKMYQIPLPLAELNNNSAVVQYDEWK